MKRFVNLAILASVLFLAACSGDSAKKDVKPIDTSELLDKMEQSPVVEEVVHPGKAVYNKYCLQCHQADGSGVPGMHPPLWPNKWISESKDDLIEITLKGLSGEIEVSGETYNNLMPPHSHLTDLELANVLSYVRSSFGNELEAVTKEEVASVRQKLGL